MWFGADDVVTGPIDEIIVLGLLTIFGAIKIYNSDENKNFAKALEESFENTKAFRWLQEHAEDYGFVMRYPKDNKNVTKIIYEPWHYRYVGVEHAKAMNDLGLCMEEYLEYLSNGGTLN